MNVHLHLLIKTKIQITIYERIYFTEMKYLYTLKDLFNYARYPARNNTFYNSRFTHCWNLQMNAQNRNTTITITQSCTLCIRELNDN